MRKVINAFISGFDSSKTIDFPPFYTTKGYKEVKQESCNVKSQSSMWGDFNMD